MSLKIYPMKALAYAVFGMCAAGTVSAQSIVASNTTATINQNNHVATVVFTNTTPATIGGFDFQLAFNDANLTIADADITTDHGGTACSVNAPGNIACFSNPTTGLTLPGTITISLSFDVGATAQVEPLTFGTTNVFDNGGASVTLTPTSGQITVQAAPPDVVLGFAPASAVAFPGGTSGTSTTASIAVSVASGSIGTGTVSNCVVGGTNASAFSVTAGVPATVPPAGNIDLSVTLANAALAATLTCDVADAGTATTHTWNLTAPAGTPVPAPGYSSNPAPGAAIDRTGIPGSSCNSSVVITNNGFAGAGSDLTYNCSVAGADFTIASGASGTVAVGSSATVSVAVACPADGTSVTDTLTCTSNDPAVATATYALSANGQAFVAPTFVPASSLWSKLALFGIFAALGMLVLGLRRNH